MLSTATFAVTVVNLPPFLVWPAVIVMGAVGAMLLMTVGEEGQEGNGSAGLLLLAGAAFLAWQALA